MGGVGAGDGEEERRDHGVRGAHVAVVDLEGIAPAPVADGAALDALGAALLEQFSAEGAHGLGVETAGAADEMGVSRRRVEDAVGGSGDVFGQPLAGRHAGKALRKSAERRGPGGDRTAVGAAAVERERLADDALDAGAHRLLHRMIAVDIVRSGDAEGFGDRQHAGVLAGAVVVDRRGLFAAGAQFFAGWGVARGVGAAFEIGDAQPEVAEERGDAGDVELLALVAGTGERQLLVGQMEPVDGAGGDQGERLHRLDRRAREHRPLDVAGRGDDGSLRIDDDEGAAVAVLDPVAADQLGEDGIGGKRVSHEKNRPPCCLWRTTGGRESQLWRRSGRGRHVAWDRLGGRGGNSELAEAEVEHVVGGGDELDRGLGGEGGGEGRLDGEGRGAGDDDPRKGRDQQLFVGLGHRRSPRGFACFEGRMPLSD